MRHGDAQRARMWRVAWQDLNRRKDAYRQEALMCWANICKLRGMTDEEAMAQAKQYLKDVDAGCDIDLKEAEEEIAQAKTGPTQATADALRSMNEMYYEVRDLVDPDRQLNHTDMVEKLKKRLG